ncbi:response regulator [bacterium]|nr:response regulator [bacterium]
MKAETFQKKLEDNAFPWSVFSRNDHSTFVCFPVTSHDSIIGSLNVGRTKPNFSDSELYLIQAYTDLLSLALLIHKFKDDYQALNDKLQAIEKETKESKERFTQTGNNLDACKSMLHHFHEMLNVLNHNSSHISKSILQSLLVISDSMSISLSSLTAGSEFHEKNGMADCKKLIKELSDNLNVDIKSENFFSFLLPVNYDVLLQSLTTILNQLKKSGSIRLSVFVQNNQSHFCMTTGTSAPDYLLQQDCHSIASDIDDPLILTEIIKLRLISAKIKSNKKGDILDLDVAFDIVPHPEQVAMTEQTVAGDNQILIVDDDDALRELLADILESRGYHVIASADGFKALELIQQEKISLVISDFEMPKINGVELAKQIKALKPNLPIAIITGWGNDLKENSSYFDQILAKPFNLTEVLKMVENCLSINPTDRP